MSNPYSQVKEDKISYTIMAAMTEDAVYNLNSQCAIDYASPDSLIGIYFDK
jgi:hypothetical protein